MDLNILQEDLKQADTELRAVGIAFAKATKDYRNLKIGDREFLDAKHDYQAAMALWEARERAVVAAMEALPPAIEPEVIDAVQEDLF